MTMTPTSNFDTESNRTPAGEELAASELRYRRLFESAKDGILILDAETGTVEDVNPYLVGLLGFKREAVLGKKIWELGYFKDIVANKDRFAELQQNEYIRYDDKPLETSDGRRVDVEFVSNVYLVNSLKVIQCNIRDITGYKRSATEFQQLSTRQRAILAAIPDIITEEDGQHVYTWANQAGLDFFGNDVVGKKAALYFESEKVSQHADEPAQNDHEKGIYTESWQRRQDGQKRLLAWRSQVLKDAFGNGVGTLSTARDITERVRAEESHARLAMAVEQSAEVIVITDADGKILYVNPAFEKVTGYTQAEALGKNPRILNSGKQDVEFYRKMWVMLNRGEVWHGHFINKRKDDTLYEEEATISPINDATGKIINFVAAKRDVTHEVQLEKQIRQSQKMEAIGRLAGGVAHDFNNMLGVILGSAEMALDLVNINDSVREDLEEIHTAAKRSAVLTRQLLAFARKQEATPKVIDLNVVVEGIIKMLKRLVGEDVDLVWLPHPDLWPVKLDPSQIDQVLANLCVNARDAISGVGKLTIETTNRLLMENDCVVRPDCAPGEYVLLAVSDNGIGMSKETLEHVFEPFFTTKEAGAGTGLGLATVYGIVEQNNGFVTVLSEQGQGTTFNIFLPRHAGQVAAMRTEVMEESGLRGHETILLVEDELAMLKLSKKMLERQGYTVLVASSPDKAIRLIKKHADQLNLMITDVVMPGMNGQQLAERLKAFNPNIKCLFMSGYADDVITHHGIHKEGVHFIQKPFSSRNLAAKVREVLDSNVTTA